MFSFNGKNIRDYVDKVTGVSRPVVPTRKVTSSEIPQRAGAYYFRSEFGVRVFEFDYVIYGRTLSEIQIRLRRLADILVTNEPRSLVFDDEPNKGYMAILSDETPFDQMNTLGRGKIKLVALDPFAYGPTINQYIDTYNGSTVLNDGTAETFPVFTADIVKPTTFLSLVAGEDKFILLGNPDQVEETKVDPETLVFDEDGSSLAGWGVASSVEDGVTGGTMSIYNNHKIVSADMGTGERWHGPAMTKGLSQSVKNFRMDALVSNLNTIYGENKVTGRVEIYLLDNNGATLAKIHMSDMWADFKNMQGRARVGTKDNGAYAIDTEGAKAGIWNDFDTGLLRVERNNNMWTFLIAKRYKNTGELHSRAYATFKDETGEWGANLSQIKIHLGRFGTTYPTNVSIEDIKVWRKNAAPTQTQKPLLANIGDRIVIDHKKAVVLKNGEIILDRLDPNSDFFPLNRGTTFIKTFPEDVAEVSMSYQKRWI